MDGATTTVGWNGHDLVVRDRLESRTRVPRLQALGDDLEPVVAGVDLALHDQDGVLVPELGRLLVGAREPDDLDAAVQVFERRHDHRVALAGGDASHGGHDARRS